MKISKFNKRAQYQNYYEGTVQQKQNSMSKNKHILKVKKVAL